MSSYQRWFTMTKCTVNECLSYQRSLHAILFFVTYFVGDFWPKWSQKSKHHKVGAIGWIFKLPIEQSKSVVILIQIGELWPKYIEGREVTKIGNYGPYLYFSTSTHGQNRTQGMVKIRLSFFLFGKNYINIERIFFFF